MVHVFGFLKEQPFVLMFLVIGDGIGSARIKIHLVGLGVVAMIFGLLLSFSSTAAVLAGASAGVVVALLSSTGGGLIRDRVLLHRTPAALSDPI